LSSSKAHRADTDRRRILGILGAAGAGALLAPLFGSRSARAGAQQVPGAPLSTRLGSTQGLRMRLVTGPLRTVGATPGSRVALGLILPGGGPQAPGPLSLVAKVETAVLAAPGSGGEPVAGLGGFELDQGVDRAVHSMLSALSLPRPVDITGFSAEVGPGGLDDGQHAEIHWSVQGRGGALSSLRSQLEGFHGWVVGTLAPDGTFESLSFSPVRNVT